MNCRYTEVSCTGPDDYDPIVSDFGLLQIIVAPIDWASIGKFAKVVSRHFRWQRLQCSGLQNLVVGWAKRMDLHLCPLLGFSGLVSCTGKSAHCLTFKTSADLPYGLSKSEETKVDAKLLSNSTLLNSTQRSDKTNLQGNIYHIVFDGYSGLRFLDAVSKLDMSQSLSGFTFFENTLANYQVTDASYVALRTVHQDAPYIAPEPRASACAVAPAEFPCSGPIKLVRKADPTLT